MSSHYEDFLNNEIGHLNSQIAAMKANYDDLCNKSLVEIGRLSGELTSLQARAHRLEAMLIETHKALNTWATLHAPEMCSPENVENAKQEVRGGILGYISFLQVDIQEALIK